MTKAELIPTLKDVIEELQKYRRVVFVNPSQEAAVKAALADTGYTAMVEVRGNQAITPGTAIVINPREILARHGY